MHNPQSFPSYLQHAAVMRRFNPSSMLHSDDSQVKFTQTNTNKPLPYSLKFTTSPPAGHKSESRQNCLNFVYFTENMLGRHTKMYPSK